MLRIQTFMFLVLTLLFPQACNTMADSAQIELTIDPVPEEITTNVPKISGKVSNPNAFVYVNGIPALVIEDGTFFKYVDVPARIPTTIDIRAEAMGQSVSKSFVTTFFPKPFVWVFSINTNPVPAIMEGWVSYPEAMIEIKGNLKEPIVEAREDGFFTAAFTLIEGYFDPAINKMRYNIAVRVVTSKGQSNDLEFRGVTMDSTSGPNPMLNDIPTHIKKIVVKRGETVLLDRDFSWLVSSPARLDLEMRPDSANDTLPSGLIVVIEPEIFLAYPTASRHSTIIIKVGKNVSPGSYLFRANYGDHVEVVVVE
jgi:hypothetical protein